MVKGKVILRRLQHKMIMYVNLLIVLQRSQLQKLAPEVVQETSETPTPVQLSHQRSVSFASSSISRPNTHPNDSRPDTRQTVTTEGIHGLCCHGRKSLSCCSLV